MDYFPYIIVPIILFLKKYKLTKLKMIKREIRENDRTAPRLGKGEFSTHIVTEELYKSWSKDNPQYNIDYKEFKRIWEAIAIQIRKETCTNALGIYFPYYTGETKIQFIPPKVKAVDIYNSNQLGEKVNQLNINTKGKIAKITWQRRRAAKFNKMLALFGFEQDRKFKTDVMNALTDNPQIFRTMEVKSKRE